MKKILACILMMLDHIAVYYADRLPNDVYIILRVLGSLSLPLFAYLLTLGYLRTRNKGRYFMRLTSLALMTQGIIFLLMPLAQHQANLLALNPLLVLLCGFGMLYGWEVLMAIPKDRIGSLNLITANPQTLSHRFDVRIGYGSSSHVISSETPIPRFSPAGLLIFGLSLIVSSVMMSLLLPIEFGFLGILSIFLFYIIETCLTSNKSLWAFLSYLLLTVLFLLIFYGLNGRLSLYGASFSAIFLCYLPEKNRRPSPLIQYAFYLFYPVHILILLVLRIFIK